MMDFLIDVNTSEAYIEHIVDQYSDMILRIALHKVKSRSEAEDITQNVFLRIVKECPVFDDQIHEKAWIIRVTINLCNDYFKSSWFRKIVPLKECQAETFLEDQYDILSTVRKLPSKYQDVVYLYYYEEMSIPEISKLLSAKEGTVMSQLHRARAKLKVMLKGDFDNV
jgi:RNA polymerase sigma-70 factor (ECF subfamily)